MLFHQFDCFIFPPGEAHTSDQAANEQYIPEQSPMFWALVDAQNESKTENAADFVAYKRYCLKMSQKARALLGHPAALAIATSAATRLAALAAQYATCEGGFALSDVLAETVAEHVVANAFEGHEVVLHRPFSRDGYRAIRSTVDHISAALEAILAADAIKLPGLRLVHPSSIDNQPDSASASPHLTVTSVN